MFPYRGIIEGFYGRPWNHGERLMLMKWMGDHGYTHYMYAPKADTYHRTDWRKPYPELELQRFEELIEVANQHGVIFGFALSPGLSMRYRSEEDREVLYKKFATFAGLGVKCFGIFFDDIPEKLYHAEDAHHYRNLAEAQADLVNELYDRLNKWHGPVELIFCPTIYCGIGDDNYLYELGAALNPAVQVFWTGLQVCSAKLLRADMEPVAKALQRKPLLWDNYPVNDASMVTELHIGPYVGRGIDLPQTVSGFFINPMNQIYTSLIPLHAIGLYLHNPGGYDPAKAWEEGIYKELGPKLEDAFRHFAEYNQISPIHDAAMNRYTPIWKAGDGKAAEAEAHAMQDAAERLQVGLREKELGAEIAPWLADFLFWSQLGLKAAEVQGQLRKLFQFNPEDKETIKHFIPLQRNLNRLRRLLRQCPDVRTAVTGDVVHEYALKVYRSVEMLLQTYVDKQGFPMKTMRSLLKKL